MRRVLLLAMIALVLAAGAGSLGASAPGAMQQAAPAAPAPSRAEMEAFLVNARILKTKGVGKGLTGTVRATLSDGTLTHDASVQTIDESLQKYETTNGVEFNFRDTWRFNVAAYLLDKLLALDMIPATVERRFKDQQASFTWWVDDVSMDEAERIQRHLQPGDPQAWNEQMWLVRVFDQLIYNTDRNLGNLLITSKWRIWMIDHTRAFRWQHALRRPGDLSRCDRQLLAKLRALDEPTLKATMGDYLGSNEIRGLLARRDLVVQYFDGAGEKALFDRRDR